MCKDCNWEEVLKDVNELIDAETHRWAFDTLDGIRDWIEANGHVTAGQLSAFQNISRKRGR